ncbi:MAG TPA: tyrosine-type recombinase/integrase [Rubrivivax sp.]|nr:tyrosine-type recombinase/integrase [Rubrivivax sp.]
MAENLLTDARVRTANRDRDGLYLSDGGGLRIRLLDPSRKHPRGARLAEFHFKLKDAAGEYRNGALHLGTIGEPFTDAAGLVRGFTLADARRARDGARELVAKGQDPRTVQRLARADAADAQRRRLAALDARRTLRQTFDEWERLYLGTHRKDGGAGLRGMFELHVLPYVGELPLEELRRPHLLDLLDRVAIAGKKRTANQVLGAVRQLCRWAMLRDWLQADPTFGVTRAAAGGRELPRERTLSALEIVELRDKLPRSGLSERMQCAAWLLLATAVRVGELSAAKVADFDLSAAEWHIPETKTGRAHLVHLSPFALGLVRQLVTLGAGSAYIVPTHAPSDGAESEDRPIGAQTVGKQLRDRQRAAALKGRSKASGALLLSRGEWTAHDLRRTAATIMRETLGVSSDVVERCLNHRPQGIVAVYQRGELLAERRAAFDAWGAELERLQALDASNVVALPDARAAA